MLVIKCCIRLWAIRRGYTQEWDCFDCGLLGRRLFNPFCGVLVRTLWVMAAAVAGQTHVALTWRTPAVIGCEKTIQKDRMQSVVWVEKFSCYLVLNTQPYLSFHRGVYFSKNLNPGLGHVHLIYHIIRNNVVYSFTTLKKYEFWHLLSYCHPLASLTVKEVLIWILCGI